MDSLQALRRHELTVVLECAGHRRAEFDPLPPGLPWRTGAVAEARWAGASLAAVLELAGIPRDAGGVVLEGADRGPVEGFDGVHRFARGLPLDRAMDRDVLLAYEMNGLPIPHRRGGPVRGWYATDSVKWLERVWFTDTEFDGVVQLPDHRLLAPGEAGPGGRMTELPVSALITSVTQLERCGVCVRGIAWGGRGHTRSPAAPSSARVRHSPSTPRATFTATPTIGSIASRCT